MSSVDVKLTDTANNIIDKWIDEREQLYKTITSKSIIKPYTTTFSVDKKCRSYVGRGAKPHVYNQVCVGCHSITKLCKHNILEEDNIIDIVSGNYKGYSFIVTVDPTGLDEFKEYRINTQLAQATKEFGSDKIVTFLGTSSYAVIYSTISTIIYTEMRRRNIPCTPTFYWSYSCSGNNYIVDKNYKVSIKYTPANIRSIFSQLIVIADFLAEYEFIHGDATTNYLLITESTSGFVYKDIDVKTPVRVQLMPSKYSSLTMGDNRYFSKSSNIVRSVSQANPIQEFVPFFSSYKGMCVPEKSSIPSLREVESCRIRGYKIGSHKNMFRLLTHHEGIPIMYNSYEIYSFIISMLSDPECYKIFVEDPVLMDVFRGLWHPREYAAVLKALSTLVVEDSFHILNFLSHFVLRCDVLDYLMFKLPSIV